MKKRLETEIELAEKSIQNLYKINESSLPLSWWQGRKDFAEELLREVDRDATIQSRNRIRNETIHH